MKYIIVLTFFIFCSVDSTSQMILNQEGQAFSDVPFFNELFVKASKIKSIEGKISIKKPGDIIKETKDVYRIEFDSLGRVLKIFETKIENDKKDTLYSHFRYNSDGKLKCSGKFEFGGLTTNYYQFNEEGKIIKLEQKKDIINKSGEIENSILVNSEVYTYQKLTIGEKKIYLNSYNLPYMEETEERNSDGYLLSRTQKLKMSDARQTKKFNYNEKGLLSSTSIFYNNSEKPIEELFFRYDDLGNLIERHVYKSGVFMEDLQLIYDPKTACLSSFILLNKTTGVMKIVRFYQLNHF